MQIGVHVVSSPKFREIMKQNFQRFQKISAKGCDCNLGVIGPSHSDKNATKTYV